MVYGRRGFKLKAVYHNIVFQRGGVAIKAFLSGGNSEGPSRYVDKFTFYFGVAVASGGSGTVVTRSGGFRGIRRTTAAGYGEYNAENEQ